MLIEDQPPDRAGHSMSRRARGLIVLTVAAIAVLAMSSLHSPPIRGSGQASPAPPPPTSGSCMLLRDAISGKQVQGVPPLTSTLVESSQNYSPKSIVSCSMRHDSEIALVIANGGQKGPLSDNSIAAPESSRETADACTQASQGYVNRSGSQAVDNWNPMPLRTKLSLVVPSAHQRIAGQSWIACAVSPNDPNPDGMTISYSDTLQNSRVTGNQASRMSYCVETVDPKQSILEAILVSCTKPHRAEIISRMANTLPGSTQATLSLSCRKSIQSVTGNHDVLRDGEINTLVQTFQPNEHQPLRSSVKDLPRKASAVCALQTGVGLIRGSLVGLNERPIPWA